MVRADWGTVFSWKERAETVQGAEETQGLQSVHSAILCTGGRSGGLCWYAGEELRFRMTKHPVMVVGSWTSSPSCSVDLISTARLEMGRAVGV